MTEIERFVFDPSISHFTDTQTNKEYCEYNLDKVCDLLNEQENKLNQIKKLCIDNRIPICLTAYIPKNCEHYHACFENHTENAVSFGESKIANKILKIINGDV